MHSLERPAALILGILTLAWLNPIALSGDETDEPPTLEQQLLREEPAELARLARSQGDPQRGALLFHQPHLACTKCHAVGEGKNPLGPDLTRPEGELDAARLVEAVLTPSKNIRKGYEPLVIALEDGRTLTGLLAEDRETELVLRDAAEPGELRTIPKSSIEQQVVGRQSIMPAGLANLTGGRREFLDLISYLIAIGEGGPERALDLAPPPRAPDTTRPGVQVYRTMMPQSGPAALAISLGEGVWLCFDPQRGGINYAWQGELDLSPTVAQKINDPARIEGDLFFRDGREGPLRVNDREHVPVVTFRGYRLLDDGVEVRYDLDGLPVRDRFRPLEDAAGAGLVREIRIEGNVERLWLLHDEQDQGIVQVEPAQRKADAWRIDAENEHPLTLRMTLRSRRDARVPWPR
jgi:putative heme-binding domain-containing protein